LWFHQLFAWKNQILSRKYPQSTVSFNLRHQRTPKDARVCPGFQWVLCNYSLSTPPKLFSIAGAQLFHL
jgi:hypothetical protein